MKLTAVIEREGEGYVSLCPELDVAIRGKTIEEARDSLREALELFLESASPDEIKQRLRTEITYWTLLQHRGGTGQWEQIPAHLFPRELK
jgi:predicted RNase H-like HicB family nuclease